MKKLFLTVSTCILLSACGKDDTSVATIPEVDLSCGTSPCRGASGSYDTVTAITTQGCAPDQIDSDIAAVGTTSVSCNASGCTGQVSSWKDSDGTTITSIPAGTYYVCTWIDFNNDSVKNNTDEFSELRESIISASNIDADSATWGVTYASRGFND